MAGPAFEGAVEVCQIMIAKFRCDLFYRHRCCLKQMDGLLFQDAGQKVPIGSPFFNQPSAERAARHIHVTGQLIEIRNAVLMKQDFLMNSFGDSFLFFNAKRQLPAFFFVNLSSERIRHGKLTEEMFAVEDEEVSVCIEFDRALEEFFVVGCIGWFWISKSYFTVSNGDSDDVTGNPVN